MNHRMPGICRCKGHDRPDLFFPQWIWRWSRILYQGMGVRTLADLFEIFCQENHYTKVMITDVCVVRCAKTLDALTEMEENLSWWNYVLIWITAIWQKKRSTAWTVTGNPMLSVIRKTFSFLFRIIPWQTWKLIRMICGSYSRMSGNPTASVSNFRTSRMHWHRKTDIPWRNACGWKMQSSFWINGRKLWERWLKRTMK